MFTHSTSPFRGFQSLPCLAIAGVEWGWEALREAIGCWIISTFYHSFSRPEKLHFFLLVREDLIHDYLGQLVLAQVASQVSQVLVGVAHQVGQDRVVDRVGLPPFDHRVFVLELDLGGVDLELFHALLQSLIVVLLGGHPQDGGVEVRQELIYFLRGVAFGIHRHEDGLQVDVVVLGHLPDLLERPAEFDEGVGADVGAVCEPEVYQIVGPNQVLAPEGVSFRVYQLPVSSNLGFSRRSHFGHSRDALVGSLVHPQALNFHHPVHQKQGYCAQTQQVRTEFVLALGIR